ncbi:hypothetical Protein psc1_06410 [Candidatus Phytoplasma solani]|nr:conserved hypothetical protein [Candidatus Phytoplasma solani]CCP88785.1 conserved hypothetical protein [Candidatus Phytoplasma solani]
MFANVNGRFNFYSLLKSEEVIVCCVFLTTVFLINLFLVFASFLKATHLNL